MPNYKGIAYLRNKLACKKPRVQLRYAYYDMKNAVDDFRLTTPPQFRNLVECLGWCGKAVDALADRLLFRGFANDNFDLWSIFQMNSADVLFVQPVTGVTCEQVLGQVVGQVNGTVLGSGERPA